MALPLTSAAAPPVPPMGAPPGGAPPMDDMAPDEGDGADEPKVVATILKNADGSYTVEKGDEPEAGDMEGAAPADGATGGPSLTNLASWQDVARAVISLDPDAKGAEDAFRGAGKGGGMGAGPPGMGKPGGM